MPWFRLASDEQNSGDFPGYLSAFAFANLAHQFAYWVSGTHGQLWLTDLDFQNPKLIFTDINGKYAQFAEGGVLDLTWSPDDLHVSVEISDQSVPDLIYHLESGELEPWPWECDRVALSPRSERLATWCPAADGQSRYAVIEWGGEIWNTDQSPTNEVIRDVEASPGGHRAWLRPWAWSPDGMKLAYLDASNGGGHVRLVDATGDSLNVPLGGIEGLGEATVFGPEDLQWSADGRHLLVRAFGNVDHPCPRYPQEVNETPCWQVLDTETGAILWTLADSIRAIPDLTDWTPLKAALSLDGQLVAFTLTKRPFDAGFVVNIATGDLSGIDSPVNAMRWGMTSQP